MLKNPNCSLIFEPQCIKALWKLDRFQSEEPENSMGAYASHVKQPIPKVNIEISGKGPF